MKPKNKTKCAWCGCIFEPNIIGQECCMGGHQALYEGGEVREAKPLAFDPGYMLPKTQEPVVREKPQRREIDRTYVPANVDPTWAQRAKESQERLAAKYR